MFISIYNPGYYIYNIIQESIYIYNPGKYVYIIQENKKEGSARCALSRQKKDLFTPKFFFY